jgi:hypothetical protein
MALRKILFIIGLAIAVSLLIYILIPINFIISAKDILNIDMEGINYECSKFGFGGGSTTYSLKIVFGGNPNQISRLAINLNLQEVQQSDYQGTINTRGDNIPEWWLPSSNKSNGMEYTFYANDTLFLQKGDNVKRQAELMGNKLYFIEIGNVKSLRKKLKADKNWKWVFL